MSGLPPPIELTVGEIARRVGVPIHRIEYMIRARGIRPARIAGNARVFTDEDMTLISDSLAEVARQRRPAATIRK